MLWNLKGPDSLPRAGTAGSADLEVKPGNAPIFLVRYFNLSSNDVKNVQKCLRSEEKNT